MSTDHDHHHLIREQFTAQATTFGRLPAHTESIPHLIRVARIGPASTVLDVACGPGLVACALARVAARVEGVDLAPAMLAEARSRQEREGLENLTWRESAAEALPHPDGSFSHVVTRYSFHHFTHPLAVLREMARVCEPGGRVMVADVIMPPGKSAAYDGLEKLRDPSHVHALDAAEMRGLFAQAGLTLEHEASYTLDIELESQLAVSSPVPGGAERIREIVAADIGRDALGVSARRRDGAVWYTCPIGIFLARR